MDNLFHDFPKLLHAKVIDALRKEKPEADIPEHQAEYQANDSAEDSTDDAAAADKPDDDNLDDMVTVDDEKVLSDLAWEMINRMHGFGEHGVLRVKP